MYSVLSGNRKDSARKCAPTSQCILHLTVNINFHAVVPSGTNSSIRTSWKTIRCTSKVTRYLDASMMPFCHTVWKLTGKTHSFARSANQEPGCVYAWRIFPWTRKCGPEIHCIPPHQNHNAVTVPQDVSFTISPWMCHGEGQWYAIQVEQKEIWWFSFKY